jgi:hypothetical protein
MKTPQRFQSLADWRVKCSEEWCKTNLFLKDLPIEIAPFPKMPCSKNPGNTASRYAANCGL